MIILKYLTLSIDHLKKPLRDMHYINSSLISLVNVIKRLFVDSKSYNEATINMNQKIIVYISLIMNLEMTIRITFLMNIKKI